MVMLAATVVVAHHGASDLAAVGPVSFVESTAVGAEPTGNGYPVWYRDAVGTEVELCIEFTNPMCGFVGNEIPHPAVPISFPDNFPGEAFWWSGEAAMDSATGQSVLLVMAVEAAFASGEVAAHNDQVSFGRVRIRFRELTPDAGYTVTHPYGVEHLTAEPDGSVFVTQDIGALTLPADFSETLNSPVLGGLLMWDTEKPAGYLGDPAVPHTVTGSPEHTNFFRIVGPGLESFAGVEGVVDCSLDAGVPAGTCIQSNDFFIMGKEPVTSGVEAVRAAYVNPISSPGYVEVHAKSRPGQTLEVSGPGIRTVEMKGSGDNYYAKILVDDQAYLDELVVTNTTDGTTWAVSVTDLVTITRAEYHIPPSGSPAGTLGELVIEATSSNSQVVTDGGLAYLAAGLGGNFVPGSTTLTVEGVLSAPLNVTVTSSAGGTDTEPVRLVGPNFDSADLEIVAAAIAAPSLVAPTDTVTLDGTGSLGDINSYTWSVIAGPPGFSLPVTTGSTVSFPAPHATGELVLEFGLLVEGVAGSDSTTTTVTVRNTTPTAIVSGPAVAVVGETVTLDGSGSTFASDYLWTQTGGPGVTINTADPVVSFEMPPADVVGSPEPLVFTLTVWNFDGSASSTTSPAITVAPFDDALTVTSALFRTRKEQIRIAGTTTLYADPPSPFQVTNLVTIYEGDGNPATPPIARNMLGEAEVDHLDGSWTLRAKDLDPVLHVRDGEQWVMVDIVSDRDGYLGEFWVPVGR